MNKFRLVQEPPVLFSESDLAPEIARTLDSSGREANQKALIELVRKAQTRGLIPGGDPAVLADRYHALLWGDLLMRLLMRVREAPTEREIEARARAATETLMAFSSSCTSAETRTVGQPQKERPKEGAK